MVSFFLPEKHFPTPAEEKIWREGLPFRRADATLAAQHWIYYTWHLLTQAGVACELTTQLPSEGIVIVWNASSFFSSEDQLPSEIFLVDIVVHDEPLFPRAHFYLTQNRAYAQQISNALFAPHWPQPNLQPRDRLRGNRFETICFLGKLSNCAQELQSEEWFQTLRQELGLFFELREPHQWHDYRHVDAVVAIRNFQGSKYFDKPATKLYNAWLAGVPFIGGVDSAFAAEGIAGKNYLVAPSLQATLDHLKHLKEDPSFRTNLVQEGLQASQHVTKEATLRYWKYLVEEKLPALATTTLFLRDQLL